LNRQAYKVKIHPLENTMTEKTDSRKRKGKLIFLGAIIIIAAGVYMYQRRDLSIPGWRTDLDGAFEDAKKQGKITIALFTSQPPSETSRAIAIRVNVPANQAALFGKDGNPGKYIPVCVAVSKSSPLIRKYDITQLPTLIAFYPDGSIRNRHDGEIGEVPFRAEFLEYKGK
jgi:hypothetical protein